MMDSTGDPTPSGSASSGASWLSRGLDEKLQSVSLCSKEKLVDVEQHSSKAVQQELLSLKASQALWESGCFAGVIPNGFYSVAPEKKLKKLFNTIPSPEELYSLGMEGLRADIILVDSEKDKKLCMIKQLVVALVKGLGSNPALMIKKIAGLVCDFYRRSYSESSAKTALDEMPHFSDIKGIQLLGQIKRATCRPRAILFKVLADAVGLESKLMVGIHGGGTECTDSYKHMSVVTVLNSFELLVDLMRFPGQLLPFSTKAIFMSHMTAEGESDSAENDSCDSPLEPNSPLYGLSEKVDTDSPEADDNPHSLQQQVRQEMPINRFGHSLRSAMLRPTASLERRLSLSQNETNAANACWRRSRRKDNTEQRTASSSPEHPLFRARGRSMLSGDRQTQRDNSDVTRTSRSDGVSSPFMRRIRRRSISITPEISDDIVRAVRAMNETLKQSHLSVDQNDECLGSYCRSKDDTSDLLLGGCDDARKRSTFYCVRKDQKAISLPSSPHELSSQFGDRNAVANCIGVHDSLFMWSKVLQSSSFANKPLFPFEEWNIDFSELSIGARVGIGFFGEVFRGIWNGTDVAIKVFLEQDLTMENMEDFCKEISILSRLRHPNVILFLGACIKPPHLSMVTEYMELGSLYYLIHMSGQKQKLSWRRRLKMLRDICRGLMCIHRMKIVHRDMKSANCLVNKHWTVKICDFGLSRIMTDTPMRDSSSAGTPEWMAPELIRNEPFTEKCDVFSLGVIMWELCTLNRPWEGVPSMQVVYAVGNKGSLLEIPEGPLGRLISDCWAEADRRPGCEEILMRLHDCEYSLC